MTTRFETIKSCLGAIAIATDKRLALVDSAWLHRSPVHIGGFQDIDAQKFRVAGQAFAIGPDRDGFNIWSIDDTGAMVCW